MLGLQAAHLISDARIGRIEANASNVLKSRIQRIAVGEQFPDFPVWNQDETAADYISRLLPHGGVVVMLSGTCPVCAGEAAMIERVLMRAPGKPIPAILLTDEKASEATLAAMAREGVSLPVYCDLTGFLRHECEIPTRTAYFVIDSAGVLEAMESWKADDEWLLKITTSFAQRDIAPR